MEKKKWTKKALIHIKEIGFWFRDFMNGCYMCYMRMQRHSWFYLDQGYDGERGVPTTASSSFILLVTEEPWQKRMAFLNNRN